MRRRTHLHLRRRGLRLPRASAEYLIVTSVSAIKRDNPLNLSQKFFHHFWQGAVKKYISKSYGGLRLFAILHNFFAI